MKATLLMPARQVNHAFSLDTWDVKKKENKEKENNNNNNNNGGIASQKYAKVDQTIYSE